MLIVSQSRSFVSCRVPTHDRFKSHETITRCSEKYIGVYELNNVALLRDAYMDAYVASAEHYRVLRAELETPDKAALVYRESVRRSVLDRKALDPALLTAMATEAGIPEEDRAQVVSYIGQEFRGLHEGNVIRYRLRSADLEDIARE